MCVRGGVGWGVHGEWGVGRGGAAPPGLAHRDIQSYSLLHVMELSFQATNGSDPFNL